MNNRLRHTARVGGLMTVMATSLLVAGASPALADTSTATANAATLQLGGATLLTTGSCDVTHPSNSALPPVVCNEAPSLSLLGTQTTLEVGLLAQEARANPSPPFSSTPATSAACAGAVASNGTIQIGANNDCTFTPGTPSGGVVIDLGGLATIRADAIVAECTATSNPQGGTVSVEFVNATIQLLALGIPVGPPIPITSFPGPDTPVLGLGSLLNVTLNKQLASPLPGQVGTTALDVSVLSGLPGTPPLIHLTLGTVTCGPNAIAPDVPVIPLKGLPIALATVAAVGVVAVVVRRRRSAVASDI